MKKNKGILMLDQLHKAYNEAMKFSDGDDKILIDNLTKIKDIDFQHIYYTNSFSLNALKRHACLKNGYWCWGNFKEYPKDIGIYLLQKGGAKLQ